MERCSSISLVLLLFDSICLHGLPAIFCTIIGFLNDRGHSFGIDLEVIFLKKQKVFHLIFLEFKKVRYAIISTSSFVKFLIAIIEVQYFVVPNDGFKTLGHELLRLNKHFRHKFNMFVVIFNINKLVQLKVSPLSVIDLQAIAKAIVPKDLVVLRHLHRLSVGAYVLILIHCALSDPTLIWVVRILIAVIISALIVVLVVVIILVKTTPLHIVVLPVVSAVVRRRANLMAASLLLLTVVIPSVILSRLHTIVVPLVLIPVALVLMRAVLILVGLLLSVFLISLVLILVVASIILVILVHSLISVLIIVSII